MTTDKTDETGGGAERQRSASAAPDQHRLREDLPEIAPASSTRIDNPYQSPSAPPPAGNLAGTPRPAVVSWAVLVLLISNGVSAVETLVDASFWRDQAQTVGWVMFAATAGVSLAPILLMYFRLGIGRFIYLALMGISTYQAMSFGSDGSAVIPFVVYFLIELAALFMLFSAPARDWFDKAG